jgi:hypothetical protein
VTKTMNRVIEFRQSKRRKDEMKFREKQWYQDNIEIIENLSSQIRQMKNDVRAIRNVLG